MIIGPRQPAQLVEEAVGLVHVAGDQHPQAGIQDEPLGLFRAGFVDSAVAAAEASKTYLPATLEKANCGFDGVGAVNQGAAWPEIRLMPDLVRRRAGWDKYKKLISLSAEPGA